MRSIEGKIKKERSILFLLKEAQSFPFEQRSAVGPLVLGRGFEISKHRGHPVTLMGIVIDPRVGEAVEIIEPP